MWLWWMIGLFAVLVIVLGLVAVVRRRQSRGEAVRALKLFKFRREMLEAKFFDLAARQGKPRGLRWVRCDWKDEVCFAKDVQSQLLTAFVGVEIHFEAIPGEDMEDVEAVGHFREASAVFHYRDGTWGTGGKALFNMSPSLAVSRLEGQYVPIEEVGVAR